MNLQNQAISRWLLAGVLSVMGLAGQAEAAACPNGQSECETIYVYRVQSRLPLPAGNDALGRSFLSLQEANASDENAFLAFLQTATANPGIAIRTQVTRITDNPNGYCNCNLEENTVQGTGCHGGTPLATLQQCRRVCRYNGNAADCKVAGFDIKAGGGKWYDFPAATQCGGNRVNWRKHAFGNVNPTSCDWQELASVAKAASCIATQQANAHPPTLAVLFGPASPCPNVQW